MGGQLGAGHTLGDYEILAASGAGGMGIVYKARQRSLGRAVALKVIRPDVGDSTDFRQRFLREARLAAAVDHPHVVTVYDAGEVDGRLFLAMQWVDGEDLQGVLGREGRLSAPAAVRVVTQLAGALDAVHASGLVHRDVKPANVLIRQIGDTDHAYLTDFGVARPTDNVDRLTQSGAIVGTAGYMAPEQIQGGEPSARSDLYALGCLFFEAIAGVPPFQADNELALSWAHANDPRPLLSNVLPSGDPRFDEFLLVALAVNPEDRFASGRAFAKALVTSFEQPVEAPASSTVVPDRTPRETVRPPATEPPVVPPPPGPQGQPTPVAFPAYGYITPAPAPARSGNPLALVLLALVAIAGIAVGALAATGVFSQKGSGTATTTLSSPTLAAKTTSTAKTTATPHPPRTFKSCSGDVSVLAKTTSCAFGTAVEQAYVASRGGTTGVSAFSPVTGATYPMQCTAGPPHVCTGASSAKVIFYANPPTSGAAPSSSAAPDTTGLHSCAPSDPTISGNAVTTCTFAARVFIAYWYDWKQNGNRSTAAINAYSPATAKTYAMTCTNDRTTIGCMGGNSAYVTFPLSSIQVYAGPK